MPANRTLCFRASSYLLSKSAYIYINKSAFILMSKISLTSFSQKYARKKKRGNISLCSQKKTYIHRPEKYIYLPFIILYNELIHILLRGN